MVHSNIVLEKDMCIPSQDMTWYLWQPRFITCALLWNKNTFLPRKPVYALFHTAFDLSSRFSCFKNHHQYTEWPCQKHHSFWSLEVTISHTYQKNRTLQPLFPINLSILLRESSTLYWNILVDKLTRPKQMWPLLGIFGSRFWSTCPWKALIKGEIEFKNVVFGG